MRAAYLTCIWEGAFRAPSLHRSESVRASLPIVATRCAGSPTPRYMPSCSSIGRTSCVLRCRGARSHGILVPAYGCPRFAFFRRTGGGMGVLSLVLLAFVALSGCIKNALFDPTGNDVTLSGTWNIDGQPGSEESCSNASAGEEGIERIILVFLVEGFEYSFVQLDCKCSLGGFDSREPIAENACSEARLDFGKYQVRWSFLDRRREEVGSSELFELDASDGGPCAPLDSDDPEELSHCTLPDAVFP